MQGERESLGQEALQEAQGGMEQMRQTAQAAGGAAEKATSALASFGKGQAKKAIKGMISKAGSLDGGGGDKGDQNNIADQLQKLRGQGGEPPV